MIFDVYKNQILSVVCLKISSSLSTFDTLNGDNGIKISLMVRRNWIAM